MAGGYRSKLYRDDAVVLRCQKLGESDRIVTLFTRRHGLVRAVAKGVRRTSLKFGARLEPFGHIDVQIAEGRGTLHTVGQVEGIDLYGGRLVDDYSALHERRARSPRRPSGSPPSKRSHRSRSSC